MHPLHGGRVEAKDVVVNGCPDGHAKLELHDKHFAGSIGILPVPFTLGSKCRPMENTDDTLKGAEVGVDKLVGESTLRDRLAQVV